MDETLNEIIQKQSTIPTSMQSAVNSIAPTTSLPQGVQNGKSPRLDKKTGVDKMLEDEEDMYTDDESSQGDKEEAISKQNKNNDKENSQNLNDAKSKLEEKNSSNKTKRTSEGEVIKNYLIETTKSNVVPSVNPVQMEITNTLEDFQTQLSTGRQQFENFLSNTTNEKSTEGNKNCSKPNGVFINGIYPSSKRAKKVDNQEISSDIYKLRKLTNITYLVPYLTPGSLDEFVKSVPFFNSLEYLAEEAEKHNFFKCKVIAKLFRYSIKTCPHIGSVFVTCKNCSYINFTPFHVASIHQEDALNTIMNDFSKQPGETARNVYYIRWVDLASFKIF